MTKAQPTINVNLDNFSHRYNVFMPQNCTYQTQPVQHDSFHPAAPQYAQNNFTGGNQMELRNSSFMPSGSFMTNMSSQYAFQPVSNMQTNVPASPALRHQDSFSFNLPQPHLMTSRSTNTGVDNLRKHGNNVPSLNYQNTFADQQINNDNAYF